MFDSIEEPLDNISEFVSCTVVTPLTLSLASWNHGLGSLAADLLQALTDIGFEAGTRALTSGLHMIAIGESLEGGADPRREGIAMGG